MLSKKPFLLILLLAATLPGTVQAVVIKSGNGSGNVTAPEDDPGFANIGRIKSGTGIYLGNRWVMTANHIGVGSVTFGDETFEPVPGEAARVTNPLGRSLSPTTDMVLFRIAEEPELPELRLGCHDLTLGDQIVLIGHGRDREAELSAWEVQTRLGLENDVWTATTNIAAADEVGFQTNSNRSLRWGVSPVTSSSITVNTQANGQVISIETTFDEYDDVSFAGFSDIEHLGRAVRGDSGGAAFHKNGDFWELVGMIHGVTDPKENQPGGANTVLFGTVTYSANLLAYEEQIRAIAEFGPDPGDFDGNGQIDATDIDRIFAAVNDRNHNCNYDLTGNGIVTRADIDLVLDEAGTLPGDANIDGVIGFPDFLLLARSYGDEGAGWGGGDFDGDGSTNFGDFIQLSSSFGNSFDSVASVTNVAAVPEPAGIWLMGLAVFCTHSLIRLRLRSGNA